MITTIRMLFAAIVPLSLSHMLFAASHNVEGRIAAIASLLKQIPPTNKLLIVELIRFLGALSVFREVNKMGPANIGLGMFLCVLLFVSRNLTALSVFGPNLIRRHEDDIDIRVPCEIIKFMVENHLQIVNLGGAKIQTTEEVGHSRRT
jgi:hypothetical protein